ncbi:MAG: DUF4105 domain-containing protein [Bacteroidales bacterium]|nr:DUF4105 domain-containing protein [Bacteroidales bacterium]
MTLPRRILLLLALLTVSLGLSAQIDPRLHTDGDTAVFFVNVYPGSDIYELEGHSAIVVTTPYRDIAYNFGVFDFNSPNFVYRFVKGETDYMAVAWPWLGFLYPYTAAGRHVRAHRLNLTPEETAETIRLLEENVLPENAVYRYNYVKDNCATRPLAVVERALPDSITLGPAPAESYAEPLTFRNIMRHYHRNYPWYQFGIDLALGSGIDRPLPRRAASFAPAELDSMLAGATSSGRPLVSYTIDLDNFPADNAVLAPTPVWLSPHTVFWVLFAVTLALSIHDIRLKRLSRWFDTIFFSVLGFTGLLLTFLIFISVHEATSPNWLYLWLNPLCLLVPILIWIKRTKKVLICYQIANFAVLTGLLAFWPLIPQSANPAFLPIILAEMLRSATYIYLQASNRSKN